MKSVLHTAQAESQRQAGNLHTPGPWEADPVTDPDAYFSDVNILRDDGLAVAVAVQNGDIAPHQARANAHLIAAAPDLLRAVKMMMKALKGDASVSYALTEGRRAVTKAILSDGALGAPREAVEADSDMPSKAAYQAQRQALVKAREGLRRFANFDPPRDLYETDSVMRRIAVVRAEDMICARDALAEVEAALALIGEDDG